MFLRNDPLVTQRANNSKVAILGLGGLGSNIASILVRVGFKSLTLVDFDRVELSNLNRQFYNQTHIGKFKTEALKEQLLLINPSLNLKILNLQITSENLDEVLRGENIICEAFDSAASKALIMEYASTCKSKFFIFGNGMSGYESVDLMKTIKFGENSIICGDFKGGEYLMAPRVMACAAMQANAVINVIMSDLT